MIQEESNSYIQTYGQVETGQVAATRAGQLPCQYVIHAVGPRYDPTNIPRSQQLLTEAVHNAILYASYVPPGTMPQRTMAIPLISTAHLFIHQMSAKIHFQILIWVLYTDGSRYADEFGRFYTGYAVTTEDTVVHAAALPPSQSAQEAELQALSTACILAKDRRVNTYTDSQYAFGIAHDFGALWANRGFITTAETPVKNAEAVQTLMDSNQITYSGAIIKVKAHGPRNSPQTVGNAFADMQAKAAALLPVEPTIPTMVTTRSQRNQLQETLTLQEPDRRQTEVFCRSPLNDNAENVPKGSSEAVES
ncbi:unnamed protein product [Ranitomeya imitator]|uniref:RNase H type-1 domain-containing protein n=1 Tax=Ranitomeya imitator TaxID=111125 RepID=A0ABN9MHP5_9NEOB|nr:unnamed protein product [Ranitomeya imitator]